MAGAFQPLVTSWAVNRAAELGLFVRDVPFRSCEAQTLSRSSLPKLDLAFELNEVASRQQEKEARPRIWKLLHFFALSDCTLHVFLQTRELNRGRTLRWQLLGDQVRRESYTRVMP